MISSMIGKEAPYVRPRHTPRPAGASRAPCYKAYYLRQYMIHTSLSRIRSSPACTRVHAGVLVVRLGLARC